MINLFITDIDGCLSEPYRPYDLNQFAVLRRYAGDASPPKRPGLAPAMSICSGRAYAYVEAVTQALGLTAPVLFESGGGMFDPVTAQTTWNPAFTDEIAAELEEVRHWFATDCVPGTKMSLDHAKRTQAGVVTPDTAEIEALRPRAEAFVEENLPHLVVFSTDNSVDIVPPDITKRTGIAWLCDHMDIETSNTAYIGDTDADLDALLSVGYPFAPANAHDVVREQVPHVTKGEVISGTVEAYRWCLHHNRLDPDVG